MDLVQLAFLDSLLSPEKALKTWSQVDCELISLGAEGALSRQFHKRNRLLAAWRLMILGKTKNVPADWVEFEVPDGPAWLRAISLKYRASLMSSSDHENARRAFRDSIETLKDQNTPLMRILAGTAAMEAGLNRLVWNFWMRPSTSLSHTRIFLDLGIRFQSGSAFVTG